MIKTNSTESNSLHKDLEKKSIRQVLEAINKEDQKIAILVKKAIPRIDQLVTILVEKTRQGGRIFYIGAGTSGRLAIVDASELPPTFGVDHGMVIGIIAGGDKAIRKAVEFAEDDRDQAWKDLKKHKITSKDVVIGISASGKTPYVVGGLKACIGQGIFTAAIACNKNTALKHIADIAIEIPTGAEVLTGSTRMKAGTTQKLVLNMISTSLMIKLGKVKGNKMIDMQLTNHKLIDRGIRMLMDELDISQKKAEQLLKKHGSVRKALQSKKQFE